MRGLISHERDQRNRHYLKNAAECSSRAIVSLELSETPVKSIQQARKLEGIGGETCTRLTRLESERPVSALKPLGGRFVSSTGGILVALLDATEEAQYKSQSPKKDVLVLEDGVKRRAQTLTEEAFLDEEGFCKAWWRLEVLIKRGYVRRRSLKKSPVLQLLPLGKEAAHRLRESVGLTSTVPDIPPSLPIHTPPTNSKTGSTCAATVLDNNTRETTITNTNKMEDALYTNDTGKDGIVMLVDMQEMGGDRAGLGQLCGLLDSNGICYKTRRLQTGDYNWFWRHKGQEVILPCLIERKRADDIARTLKEGRFWSQVNKMVAWKATFTSRDIDCHLHYILERKPEEYLSQCTDHCQGVGRCGNPSLLQVKNAIGDLKKHPDLMVKETDSLEITAVLLASFTADMKQRMKGGDFDILLKQELSNKKEDHTLGHEKQIQKIKPKTVLVNNNSNKTLAAISNNNVKHESIQDLSFEDELKLVLERSKYETTGTPKYSGKNSTLLTNAHDVANETELNDKRENEDDDLDNNDLDDDIKLAIRLSKGEVGGMNLHNSNHHLLNVPKMERNNSHNQIPFLRQNSTQDTNSLQDDAIKLDSKHLNTQAPMSTQNQIKDTISLPLMQYHCSEGGSINYPAHKNPNKRQADTGYRPTMNKKRCFTSTLSPGSGHSHLLSSSPEDKIGSGSNPSNYIKTIEAKDIYKTDTFANTFSPGNKTSAYETKIDLITDYVPKTNRTGNKTLTLTDSSSYNMESKNVIPKYLDKFTSNTMFDKDTNSYIPSRLGTANYTSPYSETENFKNDAKPTKVEPKRIKLSLTPCESFTEVNTPVVKRKARTKGRKNSECVNSSLQNYQSVTCNVKEVTENVKVNLENVNIDLKNRNNRYSAEDLEAENDQNEYNSDEDLFSTDYSSPSHNNHVLIPSPTSLGMVKQSNSYKTPKQTTITSPSSDKSSPESLPDLITEYISRKSASASPSKGMDPWEKAVSQGPRSDSCTHSQNVHRNLNPSFENSSFDYDCTTTNNFADKSNNVTIKDNGKKNKRYDSGYDSETVHDVKCAREENIATLLAVLPQLTRHEAVTSLAKFGDNLELCISALLGDVAQ